MTFLRLVESGDADLRGPDGRARIASAKIRQPRANPRPRSCRAALVFVAFVGCVVEMGAQSSQGATHLLIVSGAGGEPAYKEQFHTLGARLAEAAVKKYGLPAANVVFLAEDSARAPARGRSSRAGLERALADIASRTKVDDRVLVVLVGHGSATGGVPRFNLPGPDVSATEMKALLAPFGARTVAVVNTASASGDWVKVLSAPGRVVITATRTGYEANATTFPRHFVDAITGDGADVDKDGAVSLLEAFDYARREVVRAFEADNRLLTEHAILDDDGDGKGSDKPANRGDGDGALARRIALRAGNGGGTTVAATVATSDPTLRALLASRDSLQRRVEALRGRKGTMAEAQYERELEPLMVALARANQQIRARQAAAATASPEKAP